MDRAAAVRRISDGLGFRTGLDDTIILRLQEAQRDLEAGKTLPRFLLRPEETISINGSNIVALPTDFIRVEESDLIRFTEAGTTTMRFVKIVRTVAEGFEAFGNSTDTRPLAVAIRRDGLYFFPTTLTSPFTFTWSYYKRATRLTSNVENEWLASEEGGAEWLIGTAGSRIAGDLGNARKQFFDQMAQQARSALFGEIIEKEMQAGPLVMGADN